MNAIELLETDHKKVKRLLDELDETTERGVKTREELLGRILTELFVHETIEEEIFYPALEVSPKLEELHQKHASRIYLQAKRDLGISATEIPQLRDLSERVQARSGMHLVPAEGPIPYRTFYSYIAERGFPVTQFIRHGSKPEFTPEPDMIHDCLGHVPPLVNHDYAALLTLIGKAAVSVKTGDHVLALKRLSWFSIEFGLIDEEGDTKIFGAGILSSIGEIPYSLSTSECTVIPPPVPSR